MSQLTHKYNLPRIIWNLNTIQLFIEQSLWIKQPSFFFFFLAGKEREHNLQAGDNVEVCEGELINLQGKILSVDGNKITIMPKHEDLKVKKSAQAAVWMRSQSCSPDPINLPWNVFKHPENLILHNESFLHWLSAYCPDFF